MKSQVFYRDLFPKRRMWPNIVISSVVIISLQFVSLFVTILTCIMDRTEIMES